METDRPKRKNPRLKEYDYGTPGYYFITICTQNRYDDVLSHISPNPAVGAAAHGGPHALEAAIQLEPPIVELTQIGEIVKQYIENINKSYANVRVDEYAIMPNHIHMIIQITDPGNGPPWAAAPTANLGNIIRIINSLKTLSSKKAGFTIWQRGYFDHILRTDEDLLNTRSYIHFNASKHYLNQLKGHDTNA